MFALLTAHLVAAVLAPLLTRTFGRTAFLLLAAVPAKIGRASCRERV